MTSITFFPKIRAFGRTLPYATFSLAHKSLPLFKSLTILHTPHPIEVQIPTNKEHSSISPKGLTQTFPTFWDYKVVKNSKY